MAAWLQAAAFLLLSSLLAPTVCSFVGGWIVYLTFLRNILLPRKQRSDGLRVIVCGFPRTGTNSLSKALTSLGFPCFHGTNMSDPRNSKRFMRAYKYGNPEDWKKLLEGYEAISDYPGTCGYKELAKVFPDAKVILSTRDPNKWYSSFSKTVVSYTEGHSFKVFNIITTCGMWAVRSSLYKQFFNGKPEDRATCVRAFVQHEAEVKAHFPPERLLVYDIDKEPGWGPLCQFLNVPVPETPFPKTNAREAFGVGMSVFGRRYIEVLAAYAVIMACAALYIAC